MAHKRKYAIFSLLLALAMLFSAMSNAALAADVDDAQYNASQHQVTQYCADCDTVIASAYAGHSFSYGSWEEVSESQHRRTAACSACGYSGYDEQAHHDDDGDGACDDCGYLTARFSVTVPVSLIITVSQSGEVFAADGAALVNNSTGPVSI